MGVSVSAPQINVQPVRSYAALSRRAVDAILAMDGSIIRPSPLVTKLPIPPGLHWTRIQADDAPPPTLPVFQPTAWNAAGVEVANGFELALVSDNAFEEAAAAPFRTLTMWFAGATTSAGTPHVTIPILFSLQLTGLFTAADGTETTVLLQAPRSMFGKPSVQLNADWAIGTMPFDNSLAIIQQTAPVQTVLAITVSLPLTWTDNDRLTTLRLNVVPYVENTTPDAVGGLVLQAAQVTRQAPPALDGPIDVRAGLGCNSTAWVWWTPAQPLELLQAAGITSWNIYNVHDPKQATQVPVTETAAQLPIVCRHGVSQTQYAVTGVGQADSITDAPYTRVSEPSPCVRLPKPAVARW